MQKISNILCLRIQQERFLSISYNTCTFFFFSSVYILNFQENKQNNETSYNLTYLFFISYLLIYLFFFPSYSTPQIFKGTNGGCNETF